MILTQLIVIVCLCFAPRPENCNIFLENVGIYYIQTNLFLMILVLSYCSSCEEVLTQCRAATRLVFSVQSTQTGQMSGAGVASRSSGTEQSRWSGLMMSASSDLLEKVDTATFTLLHSLFYLFHSKKTDLRVSIFSKLFVCLLVVSQMSLLFFCSDFLFNFISTLYFIGNSSAYK